MSTILERANELKDNLVDFVYEAEGELAVALEKYAAFHASKDRYDIKQQNLIVDTFLTEGKVDEKTPLELFIENEPDLTQSDRELLRKWQHNFTGLFEITEISERSFKLMNWLTAKHYEVFLSDRTPEAEMKRWKQGDILLTRIAPMSDRDWMFFSDCLIKGKLGKPKLAIAIGEFKKNYKESLYGDAPELLEEAWESVAEYHKEFVDFFGSDHLTLPGYELNQKIAELQTKMTQKRFAAAGIDGSKSLEEIIKESGTSEEEITEAATEFGATPETVSEAIKNKEKFSMVTPKVELPPEIKKAEKVTAFSHPRWGQMLIPTYRKFTEILESPEPQERENCELLVRKYLEDPQINYFIWQQLKQEYPIALEKVLQATLKNPSFSLERDLEATLEKYQKLSEPELPEIASVPLHLHNLFEEAVAEIHKSKSKSKKTKKKTKGFM